MNSTKKTAKNDFEISAMVVAMGPEKAIAVACQLCPSKKGPRSTASYDHLDNGRRAMVASNLLRAAARKDESIVDQVKAIIGGCAVDGPAVEDTIDWPSNKRFQYAMIMGDGEVKFKYTRPAECPEGVSLIVARPAQ